MKYRENSSDTKKYKESYLNDINALIENLQKEAAKDRGKYIKDIFSNQEKYRSDFKKMLGWPLTEQRCTKPPECVEEKLSDEEGYSIYRMSFEVLPCLKMTGLLFRENGAEKKPLVIVCHGGQGTPEEVCEMYGGTGTYNDMLHRVRRNDVHVFAPQFLLWSSRYGIEFNRKELDARLKRTGSSITAVEIFAVERIIDYFESKNYVSDFGMVGMSYGGFYTLFTAAVDTRIKAALSSSFFNERDAIGWSDWIWQNSARMFDDAEIACLVYPRKLYIALGKRDELFDYRGGIKSFERVREICNDIGTEWVNLHLFDGEHEFCKEDEPVKQLIMDITQ